MNVLIWKCGNEMTHFHNLSRHCGIYIFPHFHIKMDWFSRVL